MDAITFVNSIRHENDSIIDQTLSFVRRQPVSVQVRLFSTYAECHLHTEMRHLASMLRGNEAQNSDLIEKMYREIRIVHAELQHFVKTWGENEPKAWPRAFSSDLKRLVCTFDKKVALEEDRLFPLLESIAKVGEPLALAS